MNRLCIYQHCSKHVIPCNENLRELVSGSVFRTLVGVKCNPGALARSRRLEQRQPKFLFSRRQSKKNKKRENGTCNPAKNTGWNPPRIFWQFLFKSSQSFYSSSIVSYFLEVTMSAWTL
eukprot:TRINITY_DN38438_c0_g1_i1.p1 TRINITY_DN38438_c0_g1~~TRINITY_DN38438_c0_g1_i1.p1  ORF type:complete len:119 (+),score=10.47 TRINITY_DN38438_c0_g1_i1:243-599(+)